MRDFENKKVGRLHTKIIDRALPRRNRVSLVHITQNYLIDTGIFNNIKDSIVQYILNKRNIVLKISLRKKRRYVVNKMHDNYIFHQRKHVVYTVEMQNEKTTARMPVHCLLSCAYKQQIHLNPQNDPNMFE